MHLQILKRFVDTGNTPLPPTKFRISPVLLQKAGCDLTQPPYRASIALLRLGKGRFGTPIASFANTIRPRMNMVCTPYGTQNIQKVEAQENHLNHLGHLNGQKR